MVPVTVWSVLLSGCIIYEQVEQKPGGLDDTAQPSDQDGEDWTWPDPGTTTPTEDTGAASTPQTPAPAPLRLTVHEGYPGDLLLSSLTSELPFDFASIEAVQFSGAVLVSDLQLREDEAVLALSIDPAAPAGRYEAVALTVEGALVPIEPAFTVLDAQQAPADTAGDTGHPDPTDTAQPCP